jgi:hypothetical protein
LVSARGITNVDGTVDAIAAQRVVRGVLTATQGVAKVDGAKDWILTERVNRHFAAHQLLFVAEGLGAFDIIGNTRRGRVALVISSAEVSVAERRVAVLVGDTAVVYRSAHTSPAPVADIVVRAEHSIVARLVF